MGYAGRTVSKLEHARRMAASLAYLMISQRDAVGLVTFDTGLRIDDSAPVGAGPLFGPLQGPGEDPDRRRNPAERDPARAGRTDSNDGAWSIIFSDGFDELDDLTSALRHLRHRHHEVLFFHTLAPEEEEFPFRQAGAVPQPRAAGHRLRVDPVALRAAYLERFTAFCRQLEGAASSAMGADYHRASTAEPVEKTLLDYLSSRSRRGG